MSLRSCIVFFQWHHRGGPGGSGGARPSPQANPAGEPQAAAATAAAAATKINCVELVYDWSKLTWYHTRSQEAKSQPNCTELNWTELETCQLMPDCAFREKLHSICTFQKKKNTCWTTILFTCTVCVLSLRWPYLMRIISVFSASLQTPLL